MAKDDTVVKSIVHLMMKLLMNRYVITRLDLKKRKIVMYHVLELNGRLVNGVLVMSNVVLKSKHEV